MTPNGTPPQRDLGARARQGVAWSSVAVGAGAVASLLQLAIAARFLARDDFGVMAMILLVVSFSENVVDLGTGNAILHRQQANGRELDSIFWLNAVLGVALCAVVAASAPLFAALWGRPELATLLPWAGLVFAAVGLSQVSLALLRRELFYRRLAALDLLHGVLGLIVVSALVVSGAGVAALVAGLVAAAWGRAALGLWMARKLFRPSLHFAKSDLAPFLDFGLFQLAERLVHYVSRNVDKLVIGAWLGAEGLGLYHLSYQLMMRPVRVFNAISGAVTRPLLASLQRDRTRLVGAYLSGLRVVALLAVPAYLGSFLLAGPLVELVYGEGWSEVATVYRVLWPVGILYALGNLDGALVVATGKARIAFVWNALGAVVHVAAIGVGVHFGVLGVAWALAIATIAVLWPLSFYLRWLLIELPPRDWLACIVQPAFCTCVMGLAVYALAGAIGAAPALVQVISLALFGALVYGSLLWLRERPLLLALRGRG